MPNNNNSIGNLEIGSLSLPVLNDRLRRIGLALEGSSSTSAVNTETAAGGVSQVVLTVPGILAIQSDVAPILELAAPQTFKSMVALVKTAPLGSPITLQMYVNGSAWGPVLTIPAGSVSATASVTGARQIPANSIIRLDITGVGALLTGVSFPGSDLTVLLR